MERTPNPFGEVRHLVPVRGRLSGMGTLTPEYAHLAWKMALPHALEPYVRRALRAVLEMHAPTYSDIGSDTPWCEECAFAWPCRTVRTIMEAMHEEEGAHTHER